MPTAVAHPHRGTEPTPLSQVSIGLWLGFVLLTGTPCWGALRFWGSSLRKEVQAESGEGRGQGRGQASITGETGGKRKLRPFLSTARFQLRTPGVDTPTTRGLWKNIGLDWR